VTKNTLFILTLNLMASFYSMQNFDGWCDNRNECFGSTSYFSMSNQKLEINAIVMIQCKH